MLFRRRKKVPGDRGNKPKPASIRGALMLSGAQQYTSFLITFPTIMILSRLLTPTQVGVYSVAVTFVNLVHMLRDFGTSEYLVQVRDLDRETSRSAFTVTLIIAWSLAAVLFLASPLIADFFREPGLGSVVRILAITYLLLPIGSTTGALLMRDMQFGIRYKINVTALVVQNALTILLAWYGWGYYSPAWGAVAGMGTTVGGCLYWGRHHRVRGISLKQWREVSQFGVKKTLGSAMSQLGAGAPDFVIGRMLGLAQVGMFSRGQGLVRMFNEKVIGAIAPVSYAAFSQRHREGGNAGALYLRSITYITGVGWPFFGFSALMAFPLIRIFFGDQWDMAVPILQLLAVQAAIGLLVKQHSNLLTAIGRVGLATLWTAGWQVITIGALIGGALVSVVAVAAALVPATAIAVTGVCIGLVICTDITIRDYARAVAPSAALTACALAPVAVLRIFLVPTPDDLWLPLIGGSVLLTIGGLLGAWLLDHPLWQEVYELWQRRRGFRSAATRES